MRRKTGALQSWHEYIRFMRPVTMPSPAIYAAMGEEKLRNMIRAVYCNLGQSAIASMFPADEAGLMAAADKSALFWITACGGPPLYEETYGPPHMRARHLPFTITEEARRAWLVAWEPVLAVATAEYDMPAEHLAGFRDYLVSFSAWMVNT